MFHATTRSQAFTNPNLQASLHEDRAMEEEYIRHVPVVDGVPSKEAFQNYVRRHRSVLLKGAARALLPKAWGLFHDDDDEDESQAEEKQGKGGRWMKRLGAILQDASKCVMWMGVRWWMPDVAWGEARDRAQMRRRSDDQLTDRPITYDTYDSRGGGHDALVAALLRGRVPCPGDHDAFPRPPRLPSPSTNRRRRDGRRR